jgi:homoserine kinase
LGPGFDVFALALSKPRDRIALTMEKSTTLRIRIEKMSDSAIPVQPKRNGAGVAALALASAYGLKADLRMRIWKGVPIGLGMGSSAASAAAAVVAVSRIFDLGINRDELVYFAGKGEAVTSGASHYDNVAAAIAGGFVIVRGRDRPSIITFPAPKNLSLVLVTPDVALPAHKTAYARSLLPLSTSLKKMVGSVASASTMVAGFALKETRLIGEGMNDLVVEEARKTMIPGYDLVKSEALSSGAVGVCISGAGPSMLAALDSRRTEPRSVLRAMVRAFRRNGVEAKGFVTTAGGGARVVDDR